MVCFLTAKKIAIRECSLFMRRGEGLANGRGASRVLFPYIGRSERLHYGEEGGVRKVCWFVPFFVLGFKLLQELDDIWRLQRVLQI